MVLKIGGAVLAGVALISLFSVDTDCMNDRCGDFSKGFWELFGYGIALLSVAVALVALGVVWSVRRRRTSSDRQVLRVKDGSEGQTALPSAEPERDEPPKQEMAPSGWYPINANTERYWNGTDWSGIARPRAYEATSPIPESDEPKRLKGWYPIDDETDRYWNGRSWSDSRPATAADPPDSSSTSNVAVAGIGAASVVGLVMTFQTVSLMSGTGTIWTGVAIAVGAAIFAGALKVAFRVRLAAVVIALIAVGNAVNVEGQLEEQRQKITDIGNDIGDIGSDIGQIGE